MILKEILVETDLIKKIKINIEKIIIVKILVLMKEKVKEKDLPNSVKSIKDIQKEEFAVLNKLKVNQLEVKFLIKILSNYTILIEKGKGKGKGKGGS